MLVGSYRFKCFSLLSLVAISFSTNLNISVFLASSILMYYGRTNIYLCMGNSEYLGNSNNFFWFIDLVVLGDTCQGFEFLYGLIIKSKLNVCCDKNIFSKPY